ncbi:MAG: hypothetical protein O7J95_13420 [Planctomycetota bacterium]|nr:hypothetical protein [Planctomycetota bacterium]
MAGKEPAPAPDALDVEPVDLLVAVELAPQAVAGLAGTDQLGDARTRDFHLGD